MGWDAFATRNGSGLKTVFVRRKGEAVRLALKDKELRAAFEGASKHVIANAGSVDCFLSTGGLDTSRCGKVLERVTGFNIYDGHGWSSEKVVDAATRVSWDFDSHGESEKWAVESSRAFLEVCAAHGLGVKFSY
jgi:hypothetical protein